MEYCNGGTLRQKHLEGNGTLSESIIRLFFLQIGTGLKFLHDNRIIHRDLKPENVLLNFDDRCIQTPEKAVLKIADFGLGRYLSVDGSASTLCGTPCYTAPEVPSRNYDLKVDLWSIGVMMYECLVGTSKAQELPKLEFPKNASQEIQDLLATLLVQDPKNRIDSDQLMDHSFISSVEWTRPTTEPCCVMFDDDPAVKRLRMPCGCVCGIDAMGSYCRLMAEKGILEFPCVRCDSVWSNRAVNYVMAHVLSEPELALFRNRMTEHYLAVSDAFKKCPFCKSYLESDSSESFMNITGVECPVCTENQGKSVRFCYNCEKEWKGDNFSCGNSGCKNEDPRFKYLESCGTKKIGSFPNVPKFRCCVKCGRLHEHIEDCKHWDCKCGCRFCFVCLKRVNNGELCDPCSVAPRQKVNSKTVSFHVCTRSWPDL